MAEQRVRSDLRRVGLEQAAHAEAFARSAKQSEQHHGECVDQRQAIAAGSFADAGGAKPIPKRKSLVSRKFGSMVQHLA